MSVVFPWIWQLRIVPYQIVEGLGLRPLVGVLPLQMVLLLVAQLIHGFHIAGILGHEGSLAEALVVLHEVKLGTEVIDILHELGPRDTAQWILEHGIELVARHVVRVTAIAGGSLLFDMVGRIKG